MYKHLPIIPLLTGCQLYASAGVHDASFDSEFAEDNVLTTIGASQQLNDNFELYIEHMSQPFEREQSNSNGHGNGINQVGIKAKVRLY